MHLNLNSELVLLCERVERANQLKAELQRKLDKTLIEYTDFDPKDIPTPVYNYYSEKTHLSFLKLLRRLKYRLEDYKGETEAQQFYKWFFLLLIAYYFDDYDEFVKINKRLESYIHHEKHQALINYLKYDMFEQTDILILVSDTYQRNNNYFSLKKYFENIEIRMFDRYANKIEIFELFNKYQQVFLIGHGGDNYIKFGQLKIVEADFQDYVDAGNKFPTVLGVLSCEHLITEGKLLAKIDNFITDGDSSVPDYSEMFLHGYFKSYKKTKAIKESFYAGKIAPLFRNRAQSSFHLYQNGREQ